MPTTRRLPLLAVLVAAAALGQGAAAARAQTDPLAIEKDGTVKMGKSLEVGGDVTATSYSGKGAVPVGAILMWSGAPDQLPNGWVFCDGANGTPDLSGRFVVGYDRSQADYDNIGNKGGEKQVTLTTEQMPAHTHAAPTSSAGEHYHEMQNSSHGWDYGVIVQRGDSRVQHSSNINTNSAGAHTHAVTVASTGGGQPHENRPPYYVLAYIMYKGFSVPASSYLLSCQKAERSGDILQAECRQVDGTWKSTRLDLNTCKENIYNNNGQLTCVKK